MILQENIQKCNTIHKSFRQNLYFGALSCKNKFHKNLFHNEFFLQGNPRRIFIYSIYIFICSIYIHIYVYIYIYIYIYIYTYI